MLLRRHISPVVPGRHAYLARQLVDAVDRTPLVAAGNHQLSVDGLDDVFLRLALQVLQQSLLHPQVYLLVGANGSDEDLLTRLTDGRLAASHQLKVLLQIGSRQLYARVLPWGIADGHVLQQPAACGLFKCYERFCCHCSEGHCCSYKCEQPSLG